MVEDYKSSVSLNEGQSLGFSKFNANEKSLWFAQSPLCLHIDVGTKVLILVAVAVKLDDDLSFFQLNRQNNAICFDDSGEILWRLSRDTVIGSEIRVIRRDHSGQLVCSTVENHTYKIDIETGEAKFIRSFRM